MTTPRRHKSRSGFTLVELLIVITVIGILAGFIAPAVFSALNTAKEAAVIFEMKQIELALEQFKNDHKFYPPTIDADPAQGAEIQTFAQFQRYLVSIAPQNAENSTSFPGSTNSRLFDWWTNVGSQLNDRSSLQFWLSGLCKNKQYPITGGISVDTNGATADVMTICAFNADRYSDGTEFPAGITIEREVYFEFQKDQLTVRAGINGMAESSAAIATYKQQFGPTSGDLDFRYRDYKSYQGFAYHDGSATAVAPLPDGAETYFNAKKFQLVSFGRDGLPGSGLDAYGLNINMGDAGTADNLANFTEGRLEKFYNQ